VTLLDGGRVGRERPDLGADADGVDAHQLGLFQEIDGLLNARILGIFTGGKQGVGGQGCEATVAISCILAPIVVLDGQALVIRFPMPAFLLLL